MTNINNYSGIDISKLSFDVTIENNGRTITRKYGYDDCGMREFLNHLPPDAHCIMESTGTYHCRLAYYLYNNGIKISVVNPLSVKRFSQALMRRTKTDRADSRLLVEYGKQFSPDLWKPSKEYYLELQQLLKLEENLLKERTATKNQLESLSHSVVQSSFVKQNLLEKLSYIDLNINNISFEKDKLIKINDSEAYNSLMTIPGIGKKTAIVLLTLTRGMENFDSAKQLCSYFGIAPRLYESGTSVKGKTKICKMGMGLIRKLLYLCALSAIKYNKQCKDLYYRLLEKGKSKKQGLVAVANKLLRQAFSIVKNKSVFMENFSQN